jgi:hypothetical protein
MIVAPGVKVTSGRTHTRRSAESKGGGSSSDGPALRLASPYLCPDVTPGSVNLLAGAGDAARGHHQA